MRPMQRMKKRETRYDVFSAEPANVGPDLK
jgi:hypothetical protein